jgi:hypothetical protein
LQRISNREEPFQTFQNAAILSPQQCCLPEYLLIPISVQHPKHGGKRKRYKNFEALIFAFAEAAKIGKQQQRVCYL